MLPASSGQVADAPKKTASSSFPIVALGASAGGLSAVTQLLRHLGDKPGFAVVLVQHLDPTHPSNLVELLGRVTSMPVAAVQNGDAVEVDHVYVIPPGAEMAIEDGILQLTPRSERPGPHLPIDAFFDSLAEDRGPGAVAIVLSGTGSDGSRGVQAVKAEGGITFAQDGAEHAGMPQSALATGCIDFMLPVEEIAAELGRIGARLPRTQNETADEGAAFHRIINAIRQTTGVDFAHYKPTTLRRRMQRRAILRRVASLKEYADLVATEPAEVEALSEEVLIHVTSFFRDPEVFEALKKEILPRVFAGRGADAPIRVWVPGCSTGEEVYSLAICLLELLSAAGASQVPLKIFGTDVSRRAIERARAGVYPESIAEDVPPASLARYFLKTERGYEILKEVRDRCVFATHDITRDPPFSKMDLISCRNLMIYLGPTLQQRILPMFHYALNEPGFLVLGSAETVGTFVGFTAADSKHKIYARAPGPVRLNFNLDFGDARGWSSPASPASRPLERVTSVADVRKDADRAILAAIAPAGVVVTDELAIVEFRGEIAPYLEPAPGVATLDLLRMAREELRLTLRRAIDDARTTGKPSRAAGVPIGSGEARKAVDVDVVPFAVAPANRRFFGVLFTERAVPLGPALPVRPEDDSRVAAEDALRQELASTREYLQSVIEQLEAGNEELRAANEEVILSNEELQSTNEELQTAKEELQATNEELRTVNDEMLDRNVEASRLADDLANILSSVAIPIVILGRDAKIRRFTPSATKILRLIATDIGRPITDIQTKIHIPDLTALVSEVIQYLVPLERTVQADDGRWYQLVIRPYRTLDNRIDGTVISVYDVDAIKKADDRLARSESGFRQMLTTASEAIVMSNAGGRLVFANDSARRVFGYTEAEMLALGVDDLLPARLREIHARHREGFFASPAPRPMGRDRALVGLRKDGTEFPVEVALSPMDGSEGRLVVAFIGDTSARKEADRQIAEYQAKLQRMAFEAALDDDRERRQIAQDLHDRVGQSLALARIKLEAVRGAAVADGVRDAIVAAADLIATSIEDTRTLTFELAPPVLYDLGLKPALSWLCEDIEKRSGVHVEIEDDGNHAPFDEATAALLFRAVRELLTNVFKHAQTPSARVVLKEVGDHFEIHVEDAGSGFDVETAVRGSNTGFGLFSVREQIARLGGTVEIKSRPREGTRVSLRIPIPHEVPAPGAHKAPG